MAVTRWLQGRNARTHCRDIRDYFRPGGGLLYGPTGMLVGNFEFNP